MCQYLTFASDILLIRKCGVIFVYFEGFVFLSVSVLACHIEEHYLVPALNAGWPGRGLPCLVRDCTVNVDELRLFTILDA